MSEEKRLARPRRRPLSRLVAPAGLAALAAALALATPSQAADGTWDRAFGKDVDSSQPGTGFEKCTVAANCQAGSIGGLGGEFHGPRGPATDAEGNVYVADVSNHRIQKFDSAGNFERAWGKDVDTGGGTGFEICTVAASCKDGSSGGLGGELNLPTGVATDAAGNVYVADTFNHRIQKFDSSGNFQRAFGKDVDTGGGTGFEICTVAASCKAGTTGGLGGEFTTPFGVVTDAAGNLYVADLNSHRIQKFIDAPAGGGGDMGGGGGLVPGESPLRDTEAPVIVGTPRAQPEEFEVDPKGRAETPVATAKKGTTFVYSLSEPATVTFRIERQLRGRLVGGKCRKETASNRNRPRCKRYKKVGAFRHQGKQGKNRKRFSGRIGKTTLKPGPYRGVLTAVDAAGNKSAAKKAGFKVLKRGTRR
jgi:NHL repeat